MRTIVVLLGLFVSACAPKTVPVPEVGAPRFPEFVAPAVPASLAVGPAAVSHDRGWRFLQAGDLKNAEREFDIALRVTPAFYPADTALGYVELAHKDSKAALAHFERTLEREPGDVSALVGRGQALLAVGREPDAILAFEAALTADRALAEVKRRIEVLRFHVLEQDMARARLSARAGKLDEAMAAYASAIASSPDSAILYRELADIERRNGDADRALEHFRKAVTLDPSDARSLVQIGEVLEARGDLIAAEKTYLEAATLEPNDAVDAKIDAVRDRMAMARMPEEYRAIGSAAQITRADLAALIGARLPLLVQAGRRREPVVITDARGSWAAPWIMTVARAGVMEPFANHTFQPRTIVRRIDLAQAAHRLLARIAAEDPARAKSWESARVRFSDLAVGHLAYPAASAAVAAGVMTLDEDRSFEPSRPVTGPEAVAAIARIETLAGSSGARGTRGR